MKYNGTTFLKVTHLLNAVTHGVGTTNTAGVDCKDADAGLFTISIGEVAGGGGDLIDVKLQESDDDATYTDISGAAFATFSTAAARENATFIGGLNLAARKRYIRANMVIAGSVCIVSANFITTSNRELPVTQPTNTTAEFEV